jgi:putative ABC transport system substrate-binding protein
MRRRQFIAGLGSAAAWPVVARAQGERRRRVTVVMNLPERDSAADRMSQALVTKLRELGWTEGRNLDLDFRRLGDRVAEFSDVVRKVVELRPDVIVARGGSVALALQRGAGAIPIVFVQVSDPLEEGLVQGLARPGGNITGFMNFDPAMGTKWLEIIKEVAPSVRRVAVLLYPQPGLEQTFDTIKAAAPSFGVQTNALRVRDAGEIERGIEGLASSPDAGFVVLPHAVTNSNRGLIARLAARYRLPAIYAYRFYIEAGGLVSYGIEPNEQFRGAAIYVDRILKGSKPADLPVQAPTKFELVINRKAAKDIGLTIPESLLARAEEVIE